GIFYLIGQDGRFLRTNRSFKEISGYTDEEISAMKVQDFFPEDEHALLDRLLAQVFDAGESVGEGTFVTRSGESLPYFFTGKRLTFEGQWALVGMGTDIAWRKRAEAALRESEANLRAIFESALDSIVLVDLSLRIVSFNPAAAVMATRHFGTVMRPGMHLSEAYHDPGSGGMREMLPAVLSGQPFAAEVNLADGSASFEVVMSPVQQENGQLNGVLLLAREITERKRSEEALRQAQKLESLGVLAGGIAHDFNNLLVGIIGNAGLALTEISPSSPARETIQDIEHAGRRAADLARQMLAYSGKGRFVVHQVAIADLVEEMTHLLRVSLGKRVTLSYQFAPDLPWVEADATQLRQVIMNLVVNASDAIGDADGVITLSTGRLIVDANYLAEAYMSPDLPPGPYIYLDVEDTGCGMDAETAARIFDPFFTTKFTGRGLGLAAVLGIVRGHHGALKVTSEPGCGSTFRLLLPAADAPAADVSEGTTVASAWRGSGVVLVVDDEPS
ncbi:MAG: PAS domain S-box protein, partial [Tepidiformaceae bacterium]